MDYLNIIEIAYRLVFISNNYRYCLVSFPSIRVLFYYSDCIVERESIRRKTRSLDKKAWTYVKELNHKKQKTETWKENLRPVRSQSDIHKATPKPPLAS